MKSTSFGNQPKTMRGQKPRKTEAPASVDKNVGQGLKAAAGDRQPNWHGWTQGKATAVDDGIGVPT